jgi:hypothetical protein
MWGEAVECRPFSVLEDPRMAGSKPPKPPSVYQLKITLLEVNPLVWRRIQVRGDTYLDELNLMIQAAMGWQNCHLHRFIINKKEYARFDPEDPSTRSAVKYRLQQLVRRPGVRFQYIYDYGDYWVHEIAVEEILPSQPDGHYPVCLTSERHCPPEDVGGTIGYEDFLEAIRDPEHEEHERYLEWVGGEFDPEDFDIDATNGVLQDYKSLDAERM